MYHLEVVGGVEYKFRLTFNALAEFKTLNNGVGFVKMMDGQADIDFPEMRLLLHVALKHGEKDYNKSVNETGDLLQEIIEDEGFEALERLMVKVVEQLKGKQKAAPLEFLEAK